MNTQKNSGNMLFEQKYNMLFVYSYLSPVITILEIKKCTESVIFKLICIAISNQEQIKLVEKWQISLTPKMLIKIHNMLIVFRQVANKK